MLGRSELPGFAATLVSVEVIMEEYARLALLLTVRDVMRELNLGRTKVYELIGTKQLPVVRFGRAVRVSSASLQRWVERQEQQDFSA